MIPSIRVASISDIHIGHKNTPAEKIIDNLDRYLTNDKTMSSIDLLILAGDVLDGLLIADSNDSFLYAGWVGRLLIYAMRYDVCVRVLRGTPSHDWQQSMKFVSVKETLERYSGKKIDMEYVDELSIEHIDRFDIDVLYIPDEWGAGPADALQQVRDLMSAKGIEKVDFSVMHGMFRYQMDSGIQNLPVHDERSYLELTRYLIFIGHVHQYSNYERIYSQGSFDRLCHGDEGPKGFLKAVINNDGSYELSFVENEHAQIYKTVHIQDHDALASLEEIERVVGNLPAGSFVRLSCPAKHTLLTSMMVVKERWPQFRWTTISSEKKQTAREPIVDNTIEYVPIVINKQTLPDLIRDRLCLYHPDSHATGLVERCVNELYSAMAEVG